MKACLFRLLLVVAAYGALERTFAEPPVIVLTPHPEEIRAEFERGFNTWYQARYGTPATVEWRDVGGSGEAQRYVESEFKTKPGGIGIDIFFGGGPEPFLALSSKKLLEPHQPPPEVIDGIPQTAQGTEIYDPTKTWFGACLAGFGILQNLRVQNATGLPRVTRWEDLAQPKLLGWVGAGDPRNSGTMNNMFEAFLQAYGWERGWQLLTEISGNVRQFDRLSSNTAKECALGQVAYAFSIDYYGYIQITAAGVGNLDLVLPEDFTAVSADGIAILHGPPHPELAGRFLDFVLSDAGQKLWYLPLGHPEGPQKHAIERLPVRPALYEKYRGQTHIPVNPFTLKQPFRYDARVARDRREIVRSLFGATIVDLHPELIAAWRAVIARGSRPEELAELGRVPLSADQAITMAKDQWKDAEFRQQTKLEWQKQAQAKYRRLARPTQP